MDNKMDKEDMIRVMIVDDHAMVRSGLEAFLFASQGLKLVAQARNGKEAIDLCSEVNPDVVLMDLLMPGMSGIEATRVIKEHHPQIQVIALTSYKERELVQGVLKAGAIGYLLKDVSANELIDAIHAAHSGKPTLSPEATQTLIDLSMNEMKAGNDLTAREREVLSLMVEGFSNARIAEQLMISRGTVKFHISNILCKLSVSSRTEAVALALKQNLIKE